jgi:DNA processing protein
VESRSVAVVGTRKPTNDGIARTVRLVKTLVKDDFTIVSGLAAGIDTVAHKTAIEEGGRTIAVIGTPLSHTYPKDNIDLQRTIASEFLVISQVPLKRYERQDYRRNRLFFPERNITMSALTEATIIVEAGETSGTLVQAHAALHQGRKLFILDNCFRKGLSWPQKLADKGAIRVVDYDDIRKHLSPTTH